MKKYLLITVVLIVVIIVGYYLFNPNYTRQNIVTFNSSNPTDIVTKIENNVYSTSTPIDKYATIRWGENGTYRNKDVSAVGVYLNDFDQNLVQYFNVTKATLEKNGFTVNSTNSFGDFEKDLRQDVGYVNGNTICTVSISKNDRLPKYYLALKCGTFDGKF